VLSCKNLLVLIPLEQILHWGCWWRMQLPWWALQAPKDLKLRMPFQNPDNPSLFPTFQTVNAISTSKQFSVQFPTHQTTDSISTSKNYSFNFLNIKEKIPFQHPNNSGFNILHIKQSIPFQYPNNPSLVSWTSNGSQTSYQTINYELSFHHPTYLTSFPTLQMPFQHPIDSSSCSTHQMSFQHVAN